MKKRNIMGYKAAKEAAALSDYPRVHIGCVAMCKGKIIGTGHNSYKTHPMQMKYDKFRNLQINGRCDCVHALHAEISCLVSIKEDINPKDIELYVYREKANGELGMSKPCSACMNAIIDYGITTIHYTEDNGYCTKYITRKGIANFSI